jgi:hypothetical protein
MSYFILSNRTFYSLNLQGLMLGKKLLPFVRSIARSRSLLELNLSDNLLTEQDIAQIKIIMKIRSIDLENILPKINMDLVKEFSKF